MKTILLVAALATGVVQAGELKTFTGVITDTMCGRTHGMMAGQSDDKCVAMCVRSSSSQYALYDGKDILKLSDQKKPAKFAAQRVTVTGTLNEKTQTIKVTSIEPAGGARP